MEQNSNRKESYLVGRSVERGTALCDLSGEAKMFYAFNENVYPVTGSVRGCIYDFNGSKLYSLNDSLARKIDLINEGKSLGLLALSKKPRPRYIEELKLCAPSDKFAWIEITNRCNLRCRHCYNESDNTRNAVMSMQDFKRVTAALLTAGVDKIQIIGGEPFLEAQLLREMFEHAVGKFKFIEVFTNGTLIPEDYFDFLAANNIRVAVSVYSYQKNFHDEITKCRGSWERTNRTLARLAAHGITYRVCNVLMKDLELGDKRGDLYDLSSQGDVVRMSGRATFGLLSDELIRRQLIKKETFSRPISKKFCSSLAAGHNCFRQKLYISAGLEVFPCVMERRLKHCSLRDGAEIKLDESILQLNKDKIRECRSCEYRYACFDCRPNSLSGDVLEKPWYCTYDPLSGAWANPESFIAELKEKWCTA